MTAVGKAIKGFKKSVHEAEQYDIDPQAQAEEGMAASTAVPPQIPQPIQAASVEAPAQPQPEMVQAVSPEPVAAPAKS